MDHNDNGIGWHTHYYEPDTETNRFIRIFLYVTGFVPGDSNLLAIPGSHLLDVDELSRVMVPLQSTRPPSDAHPPRACTLSLWTP